MPFTIMIPARRESTRFPDKLGRYVLGQPLLAHTVRCARDVRDERGLPVPVYVATDDLYYADIAYAQGATPILTSDRPANGTERIAEAALAVGLQGIIVNLQGDSPLVPQSFIRAAVDARAGFNTTIGTVCCPASASERLVEDIGRVKAVLDFRGRARHFTRSRPAYLKDEDTEYLHVGIYAYSVTDLKAYMDNANLAGSWEHREGLEQLRWTYMGYDIACPIMHGSTLPPEVNYPDDLPAVHGALAQREPPRYLTAEKRS